MFRTLQASKVKCRCHRDTLGLATVYQQLTLLHTDHHKLPSAARQTRVSYMLTPFPSSD